MQGFVYKTNYRNIACQRNFECVKQFLPLLRRFNPAEPVVEKSVIL